MYWVDDEMDHSQDIDLGIIYQWSTTQYNPEKNDLTNIQQSNLLFKPHIIHLKVLLGSL